MSNNSSVDVIPSNLADRKNYYDQLYIIDLRLKQSLYALKSSFNNIGNKHGWYHFIDDKNKVGISSTAYAVSLMKKLEPTFEGLSSSVDTIMSTYVSLEDGACGWTMASAPDIVLAEPTCYCIRQLLEAGYLLPDDEKVVNSVRWLITQQKQHGQWGPHRTIDTANTYVTSTIVELFSILIQEAPEKFNFIRDPLYKGVEWLNNAQNNDGGWGRDYKTNPSDAWNTAHVINALSKVGKSEKELDVGVKYLINNPNAWEKILTSEYDLPTGNGRARYTFHPKPIVIMALLDIGYSPYEPVIYDGIDDIIAAQNQVDGTWKYPGGQRGTIFELCHNAACLLKFRSRSSSIGAIFDLYNKTNIIENGLISVRKEFDSVINTIFIERVLIFWLVSLFVIWNTQLFDIQIEHVKKIILSILILPSMLSFLIEKNKIMKALKVTKNQAIGIKVSGIILMWTMMILSAFNETTVVTVITIFIGVIVALLQLMVGTSKLLTPGDPD